MIKCGLYCEAASLDVQRFDQIPSSVMILRASFVAILFQIFPLGFSVLSRRTRRKRAVVLRDLYRLFRGLHSWVLMLPLIFLLPTQFFQMKSQRPMFIFVCRTHILRHRICMCFLSALACSHRGTKSFKLSCFVRSADLRWTLKRSASLLK